MALKPETIAQALNDSIRSANLSGLTDGSNWSDLIQTYFSNDISDNEVSDSDDDSDTESCLSSVDGPIIASDNSEIDLDSDEYSIRTVDVAENVVKNAGLNLVSENNVTEADLIQNFKCKCKFNNGLPCYSQYLLERLCEYRLQIHELARHEKDLVILAKIASHIQHEESTQCTNRKSQSTRQRIRVTYFHEGRAICREMFKFLHSISQDKLTALIKWYREHGLLPKKCRSGGRMPNIKHALSFEDVTQFVRFVNTYAETNALTLPGRVPGFKRSDIQLLPSSDTKASLWRTYCSILEGEGSRAMKLSSFRSLWRQLLPYIVICKPMTDLCWKCQENNTKIYRSANLTEDEKSETLREQEEHLRVVKLERSYLQSLVSDLKEIVTTNDLDLGEQEANSRPITSHYSFDFAQQVFYPNNPLQPGPIYFLVPRKCAIFGVCCEGIPKQVNFLVDEASSITKGSNAVISYLDYFFRNYGLGEKYVNLHADNCSGQNKNKFMVWYLCWRTLRNMHSSIGIHFLITGHTKFAPDWCFGLLKQRYRKTPVSCLADLEAVVRDSTVSGANIPQLVGTENGQQIVPTFDWHKFLEPYFRTMPGIKSYQHFRFDVESPGIMFYKQYADSPESSFQLLKHPDRLPPMERPTPIRMPPLDHARSTYLYNKIRPFARENVRDLVCPAPRPTTVGKRTRVDSEN